MSGLFGGGSQTTTFTPPKEVTQASQSLLGESQRVLGATPITPFSGEFFANTNPQLEQSFRDRLNLSGGLAGQGNDLTQLGLAQARGDFLDPASNPFLQGLIDTTVGQSQRAFQEGVVPQFESLVGGSNAFDNLRSSILAGQLGGRQNQVQTDIIAQLLGENFGRERGFQQNAGNLIAQGNQLNLAPSSIVGQVGREQQQQEQVNINDLLAQFQETIAAPSRALNAALPGLSAVIGTPGGTSTQTSQANPFASILQGLTGGLGLLGSGIDLFSGLGGGGFGGQAGAPVFAQNLA